MKKIVIASLIILSSSIFAQESSDDNQFVYQESSTKNTEEDVYPGNPGDPEPAPIDQYIPALVIMAVGIIVYAKRKKIA
ncbi:hypothetical protein [Chryseobacterium daecheongense]|uniref:Signal peptidase n=1 Tax=Chryseobacterium daecheongense TaxID=192389 RepID=A0A3N0W666_9FLAO|nr:hypothetical protein [Chryseobacterium daecheongense]ROI00550.1 hypothetical protein EGI05_06615 [Chryseobacterium daecheongense]TDX94471.1 hypothetical protein BCF50_0238 [Chryseobacterium daecheongense]